ncbi:hypothetical protein N9W89_04665 [Hellea sp.]|nr:hypothetical protein [Hellea sp.]
MRRLITRLLIAQLIPLALRYLKKLFRKKKPAQAQPISHRDNLDTSPNDESFETIEIAPSAKRDVTG